MSISAKSVILDIADSYNTTRISIRSIDFFLDDVLVGITTEFTAYATTERASEYSAEYTFDTSTSKINAAVDNQWESASFAYTNQRLIIVFDTPTEFDKIVVNNTHNSGGTTSSGAQNVVIPSSTDSIVDTTYNATITNPTVLFDDVFDQHVASNVEDPQTIYESPTFAGNFISPLVSVDSYGETPVEAATDIASPVVSMEGFATIDIVGWSVIAPRLPEILSIGDNDIYGSGHISPKRIKVHSDYGAVGNVEVSSTVDTYGKVSIIGNGTFEVSTPSIAVSGQLNLLGAGNYNANVPMLTSTGIIYPTGQGVVSAPLPNMSTYGYIRVTGEGMINVKPPVISCQGNQPDDYTVIRHIREGTCH